MSTRADRLAALLSAHVRDERVLDAIRAVPRDLFVPEDHRAEAWENMPLPIGCGQTISQPLVVARMLALLELRGDERVLDVGTGSGWHAALLAYLAAHVWSIERLPELSAAAARSLATAGVKNVTLVLGDGARGVPEAAPFDAINVAAAISGSRIPDALIEQLAPGGRIVAPVADGEQRLVLARRTDGEMRSTALERVRFVPLV